MKTKAQSALEYMMTYGWAILIIVIVAAVLYSLGIFNPSSSAGTTATGFSPFTVLAQTCNTSGLFLSLGNNAGNTVTPITTYGTASGDTGITTSSGTGTASSVTFSTSPVTSGGSTIVKFVGATCSSSGSRYSATIQISYTETTSLGSQTLQATGTVSGSAA